MMRPVQPSHFNAPSGLLQDSVLMFTHVRTISVGLKLSEEGKKQHKSAVIFKKNVCLGSFLALLRSFSVPV